MPSQRQARNSKPLLEQTTRSMSKPKNADTSTDNETPTYNRQSQNRRSNQDEKERDNHREAQLSKDSSFTDTQKDIEKIFQWKNPNLSDIVLVLKEIFLSQQFIAIKYDEYITRNRELEETCNLLKKENIQIKNKLNQLKKVLKIVKPS